MAGLLYYIKGRSVMPTDSDLKQSGFSGSVASFVGCNRFIDDSKGSIFTIAGKEDGSENVGFYKDSQHWVKITDNSWIGIALDNKPTPETFKRKDAISGKNVVLGDDNEWEIPIARRFDIGSVLPKGVQMINGGKETFVPLLKFIPLHDLAEKINNEIFEENILPSFMQWPDIFNACCVVIGTNYNLNKNEISALCLVTTVNFMDIFKTLIDYDYVLDLVEKKKGSADIIGI